MILFAFGGKCGRPVAINSSSLPLPNRSGINKEPSAALPIPKLNLDKKRRRFMFRPCSKISFCMSFILLSWLYHCSGCYSTFLFHAKQHKVQRREDFFRLINFAPLREIFHEIPTFSLS